MARVSKAYLEKLESVNGIGPATARKISRLWEEAEDLVAALEGGEVATTDFAEFEEDLKEVFGVVDPEPTPEPEPEPDPAPEPDPEPDPTPEPPPPPITGSSSINFTDPNFDWQNEALWRSNPDAVNYWLLTKT